MSKTKQAVWITKYDYITNKLYKCPGCPDCKEQIVRFMNVYECCNCGTVVNVDDKAMKEWLAIREERKTEYRNCFRCGKKCVKIRYYRNSVTLEWQVGDAKCENCGITVIV